MQSRHAEARRDPPDRQKKKGTQKKGRSSMNLFNELRPFSFPDHRTGTSNLNINTRKSGFACIVSLSRVAINLPMRIHQNSTLRLESKNTNQ